MQFVNVLCEADSGGTTLALIAIRAKVVPPYVVGRRNYQNFISSADGH